MTAEERRLLDFCRGAYLGQEPPASPEEIDWNELTLLAQANKVTELCAEGALTPAGARGAARAEFESLMGAARYLEAVQYYEISHLLAELAAAGVDVCPLKGWRWRGLYERPYMRDMLDADLLVRLEQWDAACEIIEKRGFEAVDDIDLHAVYFKGDVKLELHRVLFSSHGRHETRREDIWPRLLPGDAPHMWRLPPTLDYLYFFLHSEKHTASYSFTLRTLLDIAVLRKARGEAGFDRAAFARAAGRMGILGYAENLEALSDAWLSGDAFTPRQAEMMDFLLSISRITPNERAWRSSRRWLMLNMTPAALLRRLFAPKRLLRARYKEASPVEAREMAKARAVDTYRLFFDEYRYYGRLIPPERRRALARGLRALYRRP